MVVLLSPLLLVLGAVLLAAWYLVDAGPALLWASIAASLLSVLALAWRRRDDRAGPVAVDAGAVAVDAGAGFVSAGPRRPRPLRRRSAASDEDWAPAPVAGERADEVGGSDDLDQAEGVDEDEATEAAPVTVRTFLGRRRSEVVVREV